jgi:hypothetical protein
MMSAVAPVPPAESTAERCSDRRGALDGRATTTAAYTGGQMLHAAFETCHFLPFFGRLRAILACQDSGAKSFVASQIRPETKCSCEITRACGTKRLRTCHIESCPLYTNSSRSLHPASNHTRHRNSPEPRFTSFASPRSTGLGVGVYKHEAPASAFSREATGSRCTRWRFGLLCDSVRVVRREATGSRCTRWRVVLVCMLPHVSRPYMHHGPSCQTGLSFRSTPSPGPYRRRARAGASGSCRAIRRWR